MRRLSKGFTLVEMLVTLVIAVILLTVAVPSMMGFYEATRADNEISRIQEALRFARNQAISYGAEVRVTPTQGTDWSTGIRVFISKKDETLRLIDGIKDGDKIDSDKSFVVFFPDGLVGTSARFIYCPRGKNDESRSLNLSGTGVIKLGEKGLTCN